MGWVINNIQRLVYIVDKFIQEYVRFTHVYEQFKNDLNRREVYEILSCSCLFQPKCRLMINVLYLIVTVA